MPFFFNPAATKYLNGLTQILMYMRLGTLFSVEVYSFHKCEKSFRQWKGQEVLL